MDKKRLLTGIGIFINDKLENILTLPQFGWEESGHQYLCQLLNKKPKEVFPIYFHCSVGCEDEEGVIKGEYPIDLRADKGIDLSKRGKRKG